MIPLVANILASSFKIKHLSQEKQRLGRMIPSIKKTILLFRVRSVLLIKIFNMVDCKTADNPVEYK